MATKQPIIYNINNYLTRGSRKLPTSFFSVTHVEAIVWAIDHIQPRPQRLHISAHLSKQCQNALSKCQCQNGTVKA